MTEKKLVVPRELLVRRPPLFRRYAVTVAMPASVAIGALLPMLVAAGTLVGAAVAGGLGAALGFGAGVAGAAGLLDRGLLFGNRRLKRRLREKIGPVVNNLEFVGVCRPESNGVIRMETDDNVGFLALTPTSLTILLEDGALIIPWDRVRGFALDRVASMPYLPWVRVMYNGDRGEEGLLLMSRDAPSVRAQRRATLALHDRLVSFFADGQLDWLDTERALPPGE